MGIGRKAGKRASGRSHEGCSARQSPVSKRSSLRVFRPRRPSLPPFERWLIFPFRRAHSTRRPAAPVLQSTSVQSPTGHPSGFPSGTPAYPHTNTRHPGCDTSCPTGRGLLIPAGWLVTGAEGEGQQDETNYEQETPVVYVLLQRCLQET